MAEFHVDPNAPIYVEANISNLPGEELTSVSAALRRLGEHSEAAVSHALSTIYNMAGGLQETVKTMRENLIEVPSEVEMNFGITVDGKAGNAFLAQAGVEAAILVKLKWKKSEASDNAKPDDD
jgi:hypothetical protein